jgi:hypothetical protein
MLFAATRVNLTHFVRDLQEGDLVTWGIVIAVVFFSLLSAWQKLRSETAE